MADLRVKVCGIVFPNPIWTAAGPGGADGDMLLRAAKGGAGGLVTKTLSVVPARVPVPNLASLYSGALLNAELWSELDYKRFLAEELPKARQSGLPVVVSLGYSPEDLAVLGRAVSASGQAQALEFSIHYTGKDPASLLPQARALKFASRLPVLAKLSPAVSDLPAVVRALDPVVDGFVAVNSLGPALDFDVETRRPLLGSQDGRGWLSGRAILPIGLHYVETIASITSKPVIGVGGIRSITDVVKYLMAGASAVEVCTLAVLQGQEIYGKLAEGLGLWLDTHGFRSPADLRGLYQKARLEEGRRETRRRDPSSAEANPHPAIAAERCDLCLICQRSCIYQAILFKDKSFQLNRTACVSCGLCCTLCPRNALSMQ